MLATAQLPSQRDGRPPLITLRRMKVMERLIMRRSVYDPHGGCTGILAADLDMDPDIVAHVLLDLERWKLIHRDKQGTATFAVSPTEIGLEYERWVRFDQEATLERQEYPDDPAEGG